MTTSWKRFAAKSIGKASLRYDASWHDNSRPSTTNTSTGVLDFMREQMVASKTRLEEWSFDDKKFKAAAAGLSKTRERAVEALDNAKEKATTENLHELRKRVKYHGYHLRVVCESFGLRRPAR